MRMNEFDRILDECLDRMMAGETLEACLKSYPQWANELRPLLIGYVTTAGATSGVPSREATAAARRKTLHASAARNAYTARPSRLARLFSRPLAFTAVGSVAVIALAAVLLLPLLNDSPGIPPGPDGGQAQPPVDDPPTETPDTGVTTPGEPAETPSSTVSATPQTDGNFAFLVSDQPNDIDDFESLVITISSVQLKPQGDGPWIELTPQVETADLTRLQGDSAMEIWRGNVPEGDYVAVHVLVTSVEGTLAATGEAVDVTLPSQRLHIESHFTVAAGATATEFVFDITVHRAGPVAGDARYIVSPQPSESGPGMHYSPVEPRGAAAGESERPDSDGGPPEDRGGPPAADRPGKGPELFPPGNGIPS